MIDELKAQVERTFGQKVTNRRQAEMLSQDIYLKTNALVSYNTLRRLFGLVAYTKPRQTTLDFLAQYCSFKSYVDFCRQFPSVDNWPSWEGLFLALSDLSIVEIIAHLKQRKREHRDFAIAFGMAAKELINQNRLADVLALFKAHDFQFEQINFDDVSQIGVIIGLHFRNHNNLEIEQALLKQANFRNLVVKSNVDYTKFNTKYGEWILFLEGQKNMDHETTQFIRALRPFMYLLNKLEVPRAVQVQIPELNESMHPILYGRIYSLKVLLAASKAEAKRISEQMWERLEKEPQHQAELLYVPAIHSLISQNECLTEFTQKALQELPIAQHWYQISLIAIEQIFLASRHVKNKEFKAANLLIENNPIDQIRFGYKEIMDLFITFFKLEIAQHDGQNTQGLQQQFKVKLSKVNLPLLSEAYFEAYFSTDQRALKYRSMGKGLK